MNENLLISSKHPTVEQPWNNHPTMDTPRHTRQPRLYIRPAATRGPLQIKHHHKQLPQEQCIKFYWAVEANKQESSADVSDQYVYIPREQLLWDSYWYQIRKSSQKTRSHTAHCTGRELLGLLEDSESRRPCSVSTGLSIPWGFSSISNRWRGNSLRAGVSGRDLRRHSLVITNEYNES